MIIALTGHTKGLGAELYKDLTHQYKVIGFSRSNGYDIKNPNDRKKIITESKDCDIFINLVHNYYHQTDIMYELYPSQENAEKLIINISSLVVDSKDWGIDRLDYLQYKNQKIALENMSSLLLSRHPKLQIKNYKISEINFDDDIKHLNSIINEFKISKK